MYITPRPGMKVAVVGTGISGLVAARLLCGEYDVHVFEASHYAGGHANSVDVNLDGRQFVVDTGFMVFNERTYPNFCWLLRMLGVAINDSDMSFSVQCERSGMEYQGSSLRGLFAQRRNFFRLGFYRMLADILRFNHESGQLLASGNTEMPLGELLARGKYSVGFRQHYLVPMIAAIWSARPDRVMDFPALFLIRFLQNHGLLQLRDRPQWKTIQGGSRQYIKQLIAPFRDRIRLNSPVYSIARHDDHVILEFGDGSEPFDSVVLATHADRSLQLLSDADRRERAVLSAFPYQENAAILHDDESLLPRRKHARASWNYHVAKDPGQSASVTYDLSRLQKVASPRPILLTLNPTRSIAASCVLRRFTYHHPVFSLESLRAQRDFDQINGRRRTFFCGAYRFNGFHEDGVNSALEVGAHFGRGLNHCTAAYTKDSSRIAELVR